MAYANLQLGFAFQICPYASRISCIQQTAALVLSFGIITEIVSEV